MRPFFHSCASIVIAVGLLLIPGSVLRANPDFTASEITAERDTVLEGDVAHFKIWLRNRGDAPADPTQVRIQWPLMGHLVEVTGVEGAKGDHDERVVTATVPLPVGAERMIDVAVLAPRDAGGRGLSVSAQVIHYHTMAETWIHKTITIDTRIKSDGLRVGGLRIAPAGIITLLWLAATILALVFVSAVRVDRDAGGFFGPRAGVTAIMIAIGFWLIFAAMARRDYRVLYKWPETMGTIIGRRIETQTVSNSQRSSGGATSQARQSDVSKPEFAVRYAVDGRELLSTGYDTGSSLRVGGGKAQLEKEFREWTIGARVSCWYDPDDPTDIVVKRGFGGAYIFALLPLFPFWMGWRILRHSFLREA